MMNGWQHKGSFVVQFRPETDADSGRFYGRIEHVASSQAARFNSLDELLEFLHQVLRKVKADFKQAGALGDDLFQKP